MNRYELKLEFTAHRENIEEILNTISQEIRMMLFPHVSDLKATFTYLGEDSENEAE